MDQRDLSASLLSARSFSAFSDEGDHVHDDGGRGERRQRLLLRILARSSSSPCCPSPLASTTMAQLFFGDDGTAVVDEMQRIDRGGPPATPWMPAQRVRGQKTAFVRRNERRRVATVHFLTVAEAWAV